MILGFDLSSRKIAVAMRNSTFHKPQVLTADLDKRWEIDNAWRAYQWTESLIEQIGNLPIYSFIEEPVVARGNARTTIKQAYIHGAVHAALAQFENIDIMLVPIATWKKEVVGKGNAGKPDVKAWAGKFFGASFDTSDQDACDAGAVMRYGEIIARRSRMIEGANIQ